MHQIKPELRRQDLEGIHLPSLRFSWKLRKFCRVDFLFLNQMAYFQPFSNVVISIKTSCAAQKTYLQYGMDVRR
jgi:hypothetical protein